MPDREAQAVEDGAHPLRVALGQVVVDGDDVDAAAGHRVERGGERRDERLALAGLHLGDAALVEDDAAHELDVEVAHAQLAAADLAGGREDVRQHVVEGLPGGACRSPALAVAAQVRARAPGRDGRARPPRAASNRRMPRRPPRGPRAISLADLLVGQRLRSAPRAR